MAWKRSPVRSRPGPPTLSLQIWVSRDPSLGSDLNRRPIRHRLPYLVDLLIGNRDAPVRPVLQSVRRSHPSVTVRQAMHEHSLTWRHAFLARCRAVACAGIRNMDRLVKLAMRVAGVKQIKSFGSLVIALPPLRSKGIPAQCDLVRLDHSPLAE